MKSINLSILILVTSLGLGWAIAAEPGLNWVTVRHNDLTYYFSSTIDCNSFVAADKRYAAAARSRCQSLGAIYIADSAAVEPSASQITMGGMSGSVNIMYSL